MLTGYGSVLSRYRYILSGYGSVLSGNGSLLSGYGSVLSGYGSLLSGYGSLLSGYRSVLSGYGSGSETLVPNDTCFAGNNEISSLLDSGDDEKAEKKKPASSRTGKKETKLSRRSEQTEPKQKSPEMIKVSVFFFYLKPENQ